MTENKVNNFKVFIHLIKIYLGASFSSSKNKKSTKPKSKIFSVIGVGFVILLLGLYLGFMLGFMNYSYYEVLDAVGMQHVLFFINALIITFGVLVFSVATIFATYHAGSIEDLILALPVHSNVRLLAKIFSTYALLGFISVLDFIILSVIFTIKQGVMPIPFYLYSIIVGIFLPVIPILLGYVIAILIMRYTRIFKSRNLIMVLGVFFAVGINLFIQIFVRQNADMLESIMSFLTSDNPMLSKMSQFYLPISTSQTALTKSGELMGLLGALALIAVVGLSIVLVVLLFSKMYVKSLIGFDEKKVRRIKKEAVSDYIQGHVHQGSSFSSLVKLDIINVIREPIYLINGPVSSLIVPIIIVVSMVFSAGSSIPPEFYEMIRPYAMPICVAFGLFCSMFMLTSSAISRDAKVLPIIKALPLKLSEYFKAKIVHSCLYVILNIIVALVAVKFFIDISVKDMLIASAILLAVNLMFSMLGLWLDTIKPKLKWDTPVQAMKQNVNVVIMMGVDFLIMGLCALAILVFHVPFRTLAIGLGIVSSVVFIVLYVSYFPFAEKKIRKLDV